MFIDSPWSSPKSQVFGNFGRSCRKPRFKGTAHACCDYFFGVATALFHSESRRIVSSFRSSLEVTPPETPKFFPDGIAVIAYISVPATMLSDSATQVLYLGLHTTRPSFVYSSKVFPNFWPSELQSYSDSPLWD